MAREDKSEEKQRIRDAIIFHGRTDLRPDNLFVRCAAGAATPTRDQSMNQFLETRY